MDIFKAMEWYTVYVDRLISFLVGMISNSKYQRQCDFFLVIAL